MSMYRPPLQEISRHRGRARLTDNHQHHQHQEQHRDEPQAKPKAKPKPNVVVGDHKMDDQHHQQFQGLNGRFIFDTNGKTLGSGAYGTVYPAYDRYLKLNVAIKVIKPQSDNALLCPTTIREIGLLKSVKHQNMINLIEMFEEPHLSVIYLVFERAHYDLKKFWTKFYKKDILEADKKAGVITIKFIKNIVIQICKAISFLHSIKIIHRDIKPQNILLFVSTTSTSNEYIYRVKIADFGLARADNQPNLSLTTEVVTLWYRPIELLLGCKEYDQSVDVWAIGCVLYELITNQPLFPAMCQIETIIKIFQVLGTPSASKWSTIRSLRYYQTKFPRFKKKHWTQKHGIFNFIDYQIMDLLDKLLGLNPSHRISCDAALEHPFLSHP